MIVDEERPRNGMEGEHNQMNEGYQYLPQYIYSNSLGRVCAVWKNTANMPIWLDLI